MKFGVIGCGSIGRRHIKNLLAKGHDVIAWNRGEERRKLVEKEFGIKTFTDKSEFLKEALDGVLICSPNNIHQEDMNLVAPRDLNMFIEKPIATELQPLLKTQELIKNKKLITHIGSNMRFHFGPKTIKEILDSGSLGKLVSANVWGGMRLTDWHPNEDHREMYSAKKSLGGGVVFDFIHEIDLVAWMLGFPKTVAATCFNSGVLEIETEEVADVLMKYPSGLTVNIHLDYLERPFTRGMKIIGENGWAQWDLRKPFVEKYLFSKNKLEKIDYPQGYDKNDMYLAQQQYFCDCINTGEPSENDVSFAAKVLDLTLKIKESGDTERFVQI